ncbi:nanos homolog 2 [Bombina bombina]|uniref:nanos homolog 2 n=1 Tax=Bombina bombina TaxID=8345 RepID=UPI00235A5891|nr:nanos homolog 2 [Bombina bombina]
MDFQVWKDYFQLATLVQEMATEQRKKHAKQSCHGKSMLFLPDEPSNCSNKDLSYTEVLKTNLPHITSSCCEAILPEEWCNFCKHNGESSTIYTSHSLKNHEGIVECPVLRNYVCPLCGSTGDSAHTLKYCPLNQEKNFIYRKCGRNSVGRKYKQ